MKHKQKFKIDADLIEHNLDIIVLNIRRRLLDSGIPEKQITKLTLDNVRKKPELRLLLISTEGFRVHFYFNWALSDNKPISKLIDELADTPNPNRRDKVLIITNKPRTRAFKLVKLKHFNYFYEYVRDFMYSIFDSPFQIKVSKIVRGNTHTDEELAQFQLLRLDDPLVRHYMLDVGDEVYYTEVINFTLMRVKLIVAPEIMYKKAKT